MKRHCRPHSGLPRTLCSRRVGFGRVWADIECRDLELRRHVRQRVKCEAHDRNSPPPMHSPSNFEPRPANPCQLCRCRLARSASTECWPKLAKLRWMLAPSGSVWARLGLLRAGSAGRFDRSAIDPRSRPRAARRAARRRFCPCEVETTTKCRFNVVRRGDFALDNPLGLAARH